MRIIWIQTLVELWSLRVSRLSLVVTALVLPLAYCAVTILTQSDNMPPISYLLSGALASSMMSAPFFLIVMRISNLFQADVLELHAAFPIRRTHQIVGAWLAFTLIALPLIGTLFGLCILWAPHPRIFLAILGLFLSYAMVVTMATGLGLLIRNPYKAQGVVGIVAWLMILISPMQQNVAHVPTILWYLLLANPVTQAINMVRPFLGFPAIVSPAVSFAYCGATLLVIGPLLVVGVRRVTIMEKYF